MIRLLIGGPLPLWMSPHMVRIYGVHRVKNNNHSMGTTKCVILIFKGSVKKNSQQINCKSVFSSSIFIVLTTHMFCRQEATLFDTVHVTQLVKSAFKFYDLVKIQSNLQVIFFLILNKKLIYLC